MLFHREGPLACLPVWTPTLLSVSVALCQRKAEGSISSRFPASIYLLPRKLALPRQGWPSSRHTWASRGAGPAQARPASTGNCPLRPVQSRGRSHRQRTQEKVAPGQMKGSSSESFGGRPDGRPECYGGCLVLALPYEGHMETGSVAPAQRTLGTGQCIAVTHVMDRLLSPRRREAPDWLSELAFSLNSTLEGRKS